LIVPIPLPRLRFSIAPSPDTLHDKCTVLIKVVDSFLQALLHANPGRACLFSDHIDLIVENIRDGEGPRGLKEPIV
jgi:hypothetical protein